MLFAHARARWKRNINHELIREKYVKQVVKKPTKFNDTRKLCKTSNDIYKQFEYCSYIIETELRRLAIASMSIYSRVNCRLTSLVRSLIVVKVNFDLISSLCNFLFQN